MKALNIATHPGLLIVSFLFILISGEHLGGFYALYILLALPHGWLHAILAVAGIFILLLSSNTNKNRRAISNNILNIVGAILLVLSIVVFFYADKEGYNYGTFYQTVPIISLVLFGFLALLFIIKNFVQSFSKKRIDTKVSY